MASLGDITFSLRGDTASFSTAMKGAASALDELQRDVKLIQADFRSGKIGIEEYRRALAATHQQARDLGSGIHTLADKDLSRLNRVLQQTAPAAEKAGLTLRSLRSPLASLAANVIGVQGPLGSLSGMLISLGVGGTAGLAAIAGIGAIGFAMRKIGQETREAHKEYTDWLESLRKKTTLAIVGRELDEVSAKYQRMARLFNKGAPSNQFFEEGGGQEFKRLGDAYRTVKAQYDAVYTSLREGSHKATEDTEKWASATMDVNEALKSLNANFEKWKSNVIDRPILFTKSFVLGQKKEDSGATKMRDGIVAGVEDAAKSLRGSDLLPPELREKVTEDAKRLGTSIARSISSGIVAGNIGSTLKNLFKMILEEILTQIIKGFAIKFAAMLFPAAGGGAGIGGILKGIGGFLGLSRAADTVPAVGSAVSIVVPASRSPMDQARDAWWLSTMSETLRALQATNSLRVSYT